MKRIPPNMMSRPPVKLAQDNRVTVRRTIILENVICGIEIQFLGKSLACDVTFSWCNGRLLSIKLTPATSNPGLPAGDDTSVDTTSQPSTQANTLICLIGFYHTGNLQVNRHNCEHMFHEMDQLQGKSNIEAYYSHLESLVDVNNCLYIQNALQNWDFHFKNKVNDFIFNKFEDVTSSREFLFIDLEQLKDLLRSKKPSDFSEDGMFNSVICWVNHKPEQRSEHGLQLLEQLVNVQQLSFRSLQKYEEIAQHENRNLTDYLRLVIKQRIEKNTPKPGGSKVTSEASITVSEELKMKAENSSINVDTNNQYNLMGASSSTSNDLTTKPSRSIFESVFKNGKWVGLVYKPNRLPWHPQPSESTLLAKFQNWLGNISR